MVDTQTIKKLTFSIGVALILLSISGTLQAAQETIVSKKDADFVFSLTN